MALGTEEVFSARAVVFKVSNAGDPPLFSERKPHAEAQHGEQARAEPAPDRASGLPSGHLPQEAGFLGPMNDEQQLQ